MMNKRNIKIPARFAKLIFFLMIGLTVSGQSFEKLPVGYPDRSSSMDVLPGFKNPPKGYGDVAFFWWEGDTLTREHLTWELDRLKDKGISSLQINYCHTDKGGLSWGLSMPSKPALFTDAWWDLMKWFLPEARKRGMSVSLSDYTLGIGQGFSFDEALKENPDLNGSLIKQVSMVLENSGTSKLPGNLLSVTAFKIEDNKDQPATRMDLMSEVKNGILTYNFGKETWRVFCVYSEKVIPSFDPMNPASGKAYNTHFFEKFENVFPGEGGKGLNFFFSDELDFHLSGNLWNKNFAAEFKKRKGYDVVPFLDALYTDIGDKTSKIRLDYNDVLVSLSEENFFKPVFQWHEDRGMIFGCDHGGRGKNVTEFGDYFRTQRWNQGPGSDQPMLQKDIIKAKVASSIAHLYERPRVWLEGFYGSGWGTTTEGVSDAIFSNFVAGYNLLSFHGLYYSTYGGWWEWAPPCNHYHMPYWQHINPLMDCVERLSYTLSQGYHRCDVAILYPVDAMVADIDGESSVAAAFQAGEALYAKSIDFDFMDYESLARCEVKNGELAVSGEFYKVLVVPSMKAIRFASLQKIEEFKNAGGIVVNIGALPEATEKNGANDKEVTDLVSKIFTSGKNIVKCNKGDDVPNVIENLYSPHFKVLTAIDRTAYNMHRVIGERDIYALYNYPKGTKCFFKAKGTVELWNPWTGKVTSLANFAKPVSGGTELELPLSEKEIQLIVFSPEGYSKSGLIIQPAESEPVKKQIIDGDWEFELKPVLDNTWADYEFPAFEGFIGAQMRQPYFAENKDFEGGKITFDESWKPVTCAFGPHFLKLGALAVLPSEAELLKLVPQKPGDETLVDGSIYKWEEYCFSWQHGVEGDAGHQGFHGLKGQMYDDFIRLGAIGTKNHSSIRIPEKAGNYYILSTSVIAPSDSNFDLLTGEVKPVALYINGSKVDLQTQTIKLNKGNNPVLAVYNKACETYLVFRKPGVPKPQKQPISMCWYGDDAVLPFDCYSAGGAKSGLFAFESAPGLSSFTFDAYGSVSVWVDGITVKPVIGIKQPDELTSYQVNLKELKPKGAQVVIKIGYKPGYEGAAALPQYIRQTCGQGSIVAGDWSKIQGLKAYSGGVWYRKKITIDASDIKKRLELDLGNVVSTAEVLVNGKSAGIKLTPPWKFDISGLVVVGNNQVEILIYNTLANHYTTIPTNYGGSTVSGMLGPVSLNYFAK
ncbi:MAG TPA: glycosyl hydrolase [Prolixibacteraceae bacterium]|nr:glycosyl hydrolase [Prolixibacteraceae bacterium]